MNGPTNTEKRFEITRFRTSVRQPEARRGNLIIPLRKIILAIGLIWIFMVGLGWGGSRPEKIPVAASIIPLGDFCHQIGGDRVQVLVLVPPGASPHIFEPSPAVVARALQARILVYVGAGFDPWAARLLKTQSRHDREVVKAVQGIPLLREVDTPQQGNTATAEHQQSLVFEQSPRSESGSREQGNPHVWLDPVLAQDICRRIAAALIAVDSEHRRLYEDNLRRYLKKLAALHQEIQNRVATFRKREYVCMHPAFAYFARRYGLRQVGVIEPAPGREPSPRHIQNIIEVLRKHRLRVVFAEPQLSPRVATVIAREAGAEVLMLDPLGGRPPYGSDYLQLMRFNLAKLQQAMQ